MIRRVEGLKMERGIGRGSVRDRRMSEENRRDKDTRRGGRTAGEGMGTGVVREEGIRIEGVVHKLIHTWASEYIHG